MKNIREVMRDIKPRQEYKSAIKNVKCTHNGTIVIESLDKEESCNMIFDESVMYELVRDKVCFSEAFKNYLEGTPIESVESGEKYKYKDGQHLTKRKDGGIWFEYGQIGINEIKGEWYIDGVQ